MSKFIDSLTLLKLTTGKFIRPYLIVAGLLAIPLISCSTSKEVISWNVELKDSEIPITDKCDPKVKLSAIKSAEEPMLIPATEEREGRVKVFGIPCNKDEEPPVYEIPMERVKRITYVSDPLMPPKEVAAGDLPKILGCCRTRDGWWIFDKIEIKGDIGYRGSKDEVTYPGNPPTTYKSSFFNFDRGGSTMIIGLDLVFSWNVAFIDESGKFQLGLLTGAWPMDGSLFVPAGLNARYTFNQHPAQYSETCNSWYLYGNIGLPFDFNTKAPIIAKTIGYQRYFYGIGIGYDWAINCNMDFSLDLGYRKTNLPLPEITCCPSTPSDKRNPFRNSSILLLRAGITF